MYKKFLFISMLLPMMLAGCDRSSTDKQVDEQANAAMSAPDQVPDSSALDTAPNAQSFASPQATEPTQTTPSTPPVTGDMTPSVPGVAGSANQPMPNKDATMTPSAPNNGAGSTMDSENPANTTR